MKKILKLYLALFILGLTVSCSQLQNHTNNFEKGATDVSHAKDEKQFLKSMAKPDMHAQNYANAQAKSKSPSVTNHNSLSAGFGTLQRSAVLNIAVLTDASGSNSEIKNSIRDAIRLASKELGKANVNVIELDSSVSLQNKGRFNAIISSLSGNQANAVQNYSKGTPHITLNSPQDAIYGLLKLNIKIEQKLDRLLYYAANKNIKTIYALLPEDSVNVENFLLNNRKKYAVEDIVLLKYSVKQGSQNANLAKAFENLETLMQHKVTDSALLLPQSGSELRKIYQYLAESQSSAVKQLTLLCSNMSHETALAAVSHKLWFADVELTEQHNFATRFKATYRYQPHYIASLAYDAAALLFTVIHLDDTKLVLDPTDLHNASGFRGVNGVFRFSQDGSCERLLAVFEITANQFVEIDKAATSFPSSND